MSTEIPQLLDQARDKAAIDAPVAQIEAEVIDLMAVFEARMQHHFKRGPFYKKLRALLVEDGNPVLADSVHHYAQAINVLKHGTGASYRELKSAKSLPFTLKIPAGNIRLVDVTQDEFYFGVVDTLTQAYAVLNTR